MSITVRELLEEMVRVLDTPNAIVSLKDLRTGQQTEILLVKYENRCSVVIEHESDNEEAP